MKTATLPPVVYHPGAKRKQRAARPSPSRIELTIGLSPYDYSKLEELASANGVSLNTQAARSLNTHVHRETIMHSGPVAHIETLTREIRHVCHHMLFPGGVPDRSRPEFNDANS
jgi:hypothetical protein